MHEPVDRRVGNGFGHQLVEAAGMEIRADGERTALIGGVDDAIEGLGRLGGDGEKADIVDLCRRRHKSTYAELVTMPTS